LVFGVLFEAGRGRFWGISFHNIRILAMLAPYFTLTIN
jgi:hypothetical protein